ncbi:4292_t:CDS:2 [Diversispora eburnea]|uniref:4292_t:CDS:1 n=1 Tax=Diversispora eburnea TaxID=1213867 RepID=A0A9N9BGG7_9GLOM|nr:4292_t:CDS:2 [Diversispora eburnea]
MNFNDFILQVVGFPKEIGLGLGICNEKSATVSGSHIFGFDIVKLHQCRLEIFTSSKISRKRSLSLTQFKSEQNKQFASFDKDVEQTFS